MSKIEIRKIGITLLDTDCIVNAANSHLAEGGGVCGAIFSAAGSCELTEACEKIGHCPTGSAVITSGFKLKARYIIHAVGPIWNGGKSGEKEKLFSAYSNSMKLALENGCHSIGFPLISAGIYGYPLREAWEVAVKAVKTFQNKYSDYTLNVVFAVIDDKIMEIGREVLETE